MDSIVETEKELKNALKTAEIEYDSNYHELNDEPKIEDSKRFLKKINTFLSNGLITKTEYNRCKKLLLYQDEKVNAALL